LSATGSFLRNVLHACQRNPTSPSENGESVSCQTLCRLAPDIRDHGLRALKITVELSHEKFYIIIVQRDYINVDNILYLP